MCALCSSNDSSTKNDDRLIMKKQQVHKVHSVGNNLQFSAQFDVIIIIIVDKWTVVLAACFCTCSFDSLFVN